jgi:hypothetical protein
MTGPLAPTNDRIWGPFRSLVNLLIQPTRFYGTYEYTITGTNGTTVNATPNDPSLNLPSINGAELRADSIATQTPTVGNICHIIFVNGDPAKYKCSWSAPSPQSAAIAGGTSGVVRQSDAIGMGVLTAGPYTVSQTTPPSLLVPGLTGIVTGGSSKVNCG